MNKLYAFWKYDIFPHVCSGTVKNIDGEGHCEIKEYGGNQFFAVDKIVSFEAGKEIRAKLDELEAQYRKDEKLLREWFTKERDKIIKL